MARNHWRPFQELTETFQGGQHHQSLDLAADVYEQDGNVIAKMNVPGIDPEMLEIEIEEDHLHIFGERSEEEDVEDKDYYKKEICYGSFERIIPLPCAVDEDKTRAEYRDGVLIITMPKTNHQQKEVKSIKVTRR